MELQLTDQELDVLRDILQRERGNVREEAYKTEDYDYKQMVKSREAVILSLLQKVGGA